MSSHDLSVQTRSVRGKEAAKKLRQQGLIPAVAYGHGEEPTTFSIESRALRDLLAHGHTHGLLNLQTGNGPALPVIIKSLQRHPKTHAVQSVDFLRVALNEKITSTVPIVLTGEPPSLKTDGGVLVQALHEIQVSAYPQDLPESISVDVTGLEFNGAPIHVNEIPTIPGVEFVTSGDEPVAVVNPPEVEPEPEVEAPAASSVPADHGDTDAAADAAEAASDTGGDS